jgi:hypothetical protein
VCDKNCMAQTLRLISSLRLRRMKKKFYRNIFRLGSEASIRATLNKENNVGEGVTCEKSEQGTSLQLLVLAAMDLYLVMSSSLELFSRRRRGCIIGPVWSRLGRI